MFNNKLFKFLLTRLNGIPVYRSSEEKYRIRENFTTIQYCKDILKNNGIIIIFAEGYTMHDWNLKPIKSGISKIVRHAIMDSYLKERLVVMPVGLTYSDYRHPAKAIIIQTGKAFHPGTLPAQQNDGQWKRAFNTILFQHIQPLVPRMASGEKEKMNTWQILLQNIPPPANCNTIAKLHNAASKIEQSAYEPLPGSIKRKFVCKNKNEFYRSLLFLLLLLFPGLAGLLMNALYYFPVSRWAYYKTRNTFFYDALLCGLMIVTYPLYIIIAALALHYASPLIFWLWLPILPFTGWCTVQLHAVFLEMTNYLRLSVPERKSIRELENSISR